MNNIEMTSLKRKIDSYNVLEESTPGVHQEVKRFKSLKEEDLYNTLEFVPKQQRGLVVSSFDEELKLMTDLKVPQKLNSHEILIKNKFIGLNHVDWKSKKYRFNIYSFPWVNGRECSGIVVRRGDKVDADEFPLGCEVFVASTTYRDLRTSTFQEYTVFDSRLVWKVPERIGLDFAAGIGVSLVTAGASLSSAVEAKSTDSLVVWGGSTSVGIFVIQLARQIGFEKVIAVTSKKHEKYLSSLGATHIVHREDREETIIKNIQKACPEGVSCAVDLISKKTAEALVKVISSRGRLVCAAGCPDILQSDIVVEPLNIKKFHEDVAYGERFVKFTSNLLDKGRLKPMCSLKLFKGLDHFGQGIVNGLRELEQRGASAEKYVVGV